MMSRKVNKEICKARKVGAFDCFLTFAQKLGGLCVNPTGFKMT
jgi:hypothetical protein